MSDNFLSAAELRIREDERAGLIWTLDLLENKKITKKKDNGFDMSACAEASTCGTVACIGGWTKIYMLGIQPNEHGVYVLSESEKGEVNRYVGYTRSYMQGPHSGSPVLEELFFPTMRNFRHLSYEDIKRKDAAKALRRFLETAKVVWEFSNA